MINRLIHNHTEKGKDGKRFFGSHTIRVRMLIALSFVRHAGRQANRQREKILRWFNKLHEFGWE